MKILQISPHYYPFYGGVEEVVRQYSERLVKNHQAEIDVLTAQDEQAPLTEKLNGVNVLRLAALPEFLTDFQKIATYPKAIGDIKQKLFKEKFDLYHLHANKRFLTDVGAYFLTNQKKKFVFSPHAGQFGTSLLGKLHNRTIGKLAFKANKVLVVSEFEKRLLQRNGFRDNTVVIPNGIDLEEFKVTSNYLARYNLNKRIKILFVGRLTASKGVDLLPLIASSLAIKYPEIIFIVVGSDGGYKKHLEKAVRDQKLKNYFLFLDALPRPYLLSVFKNADVFLLPTRSEAFGMVLVEAMAAGLPIVAASNTAVPELIQETITGLLAETGNPISFVEKISYLIDNPSVRIQLKDQGLKQSQEYDWNKIVARLYGIYEEVLK